MTLPFVLGIAAVVLVSQPGVLLLPPIAFVSVPT